MTGVDILNSTLSALTTTIDRQSGNLAATNDPYGIAQTTTLSTNVADGNILGLTASAPSFNVPKEVTEAIIQFGGEAGYQATLDQKLQMLEPYIGQIGSLNSLTHIFDGFKSALMTFAAIPHDGTVRKDLIHSAESLTKALNTFENQVQKLRTSCEADIQQNVTKIRNLLNTISTQNSEIVKAKMQGSTNPAAYGKRLEALAELSQLFDVDVAEQSNGAVSITSCGITLLNQNAIAQISFTSSVGINASYTYPGLLQGLMVNGIDMTHSLVLGKNSQISGLFALRDQYLPNYSQVMDQFTNVLQEEINAAHNNGSGFPATQNLTGTKEVLGADQFYGNGSFRLATLDAKGIIQNFGDFDLSTFADVNAIMGAINGTFGAGTASIVNGKFVLQAQGGLSLAINENTSQMLDANIRVQLYDQNNAQIIDHVYATGGGLAAVVNALNADFGVNATATQDGTHLYINPNNSNNVSLNEYPKAQSVSIRSKGFSHYFGLNNFFTVETQRSNCSATEVIKVTPNVRKNAGAISFSALSLTEGIGGRGITSEGVPTQNGLKPSEIMRDVMNQNFTFQTRGGAGGSVGALTDYFSVGLSQMAGDANYAKEFAESAKANLEQAFTNFQKIAKQDMTQITQKLAELIASVQTIALALAKSNDLEMHIMNKVAG